VCSVLAVVSEHESTLVLESHASHAPSFNKYPALQLVATLVVQVAAPVGHLTQIAYSLIYPVKQVEAVAM